MAGLKDERNGEREGGTVNSKRITAGMKREAE